MQGDSGDSIDNEHLPSLSEASKVCFKLFLLGPPESAPKLCQVNCFPRLIDEPCHTVLASAFKKKDLRTIKLVLEQYPQKPWRPCMVTAYATVHQ